MYTESQLSKEAASAKDGGLTSMKKQLASMLAPMLVEKLDGSFITIRPREMVFTTNEGIGKVWAYEIIERPAKDTWLVKTGDEEVQTYAREGERLSCPATGDLQFKAYYLQVEK